MADGDGFRDDYCALLIGNGTFPEGQNRLPDLKGPANDVRELKKALTDPEFALFREENVEVCPDFDTASIQEALDGLVSKVKRAEHFLLYYSGHGLDQE